MPTRSRKESPAGQKEMPSLLKAPPAKSSGIFLIHGDDDFLVLEEARKIIDRLSPKGGSEYNLETIEGTAANQEEAGSVFRKLFESLQSQSFFATEKTIWLRGTNLLGASPTATSNAVNDFLTALEELLKKGLPDGVKLVITASEVDGRRGFVKSLQKLATCTTFKDNPFKREETQARATTFLHDLAKTQGKKLGENVDLLMVEMGESDTRTILSEFEKLCTFVGERNEINLDDVRAIGSWRPGGVIWDLQDAVSSRNLHKSLEIVEDLLFVGEAPIGMLAVIISRMRLLMAFRSLLDCKILKPTPNYNDFRSQVERIQAEKAGELPEDKKINPLTGHPFVLWKAFPGASRFKTHEIQENLKLLLECNEAMVSGGGEPGGLLRNVITRICMGA